MTAVRPPQGAELGEVLRRPGPYWRQFRHLTLEQVFWRAVFRLWRPQPGALPRVPSQRTPLGDWLPPPRRRSHPTEIRPPSCSPGYWFDSSLGARGLSQRHQFVELQATDGPDSDGWQARWLGSWIAENPPTKGVGWWPYPLSRRMVNWLKWSLAGNRLPASALKSLGLQARFLSRRCERDLLGNHLLANAKALVFAGLVLDDELAPRWLARGEKLLRRELPRQILDDGGHVERSPMYHALVLEDLCDLLNLYRALGRPDALGLGDRIGKMNRWLTLLSHPDGGIALFNDSAHGVASEPYDLDAYARRLGCCEEPVYENEDLRHLAASGYVRLSQGPAVVLADAAPLGPDYLAGHGHADTLTFEMSLEGRRWIVDSGTSTYECGARRTVLRSTAAHNTAVVDDHDSSELWDAFRVGRRARIRAAEGRVSKGEVRFTAAHDGYCRLPGVGLHRREWLLDGAGLLIRDAIEGAGRHRLQSALHLHPHVRVESSADNCLVLRHAKAKSRIQMTFEAPMKWRTEDSEYHPELDRSVPNQKLVGLWEGELPIRLACALRWA